MKIKKISSSIFYIYIYCARAPLEHFHKKLYARGVSFKVMYDVHIIYLITRACILCGDVFERAVENKRNVSAYNSKDSLCLERCLLPDVWHPKHEAYEAFIICKSNQRYVRILRKFLKREIVSFKPQKRGEMIELFTITQLEAYAIYEFAIFHLAVGIVQKNNCMHFTFRPLAAFSHTHCTEIDRTFFWLLWKEHKIFHQYIDRDFAVNALFWLRAVQESEIVGSFYTFQYIEEYIMCAASASVRTQSAHLNTMSRKRARPRERAG